eukprot:CAMPEP_0169282136 /NCGR_PEP_ID=MMETSP1016-20121227/56708_1 /TAXON_ID=342587 /ORGANISM="Karlodinium micrum, Strain CCMP2283" /LENGTH=122 /DNA_ID=CAMNT_0009370965 /DNA_START=38 /DNA_END=402 /DNA_ORIENTATION=+
MAGMEIGNMGLPEPPVKTASRSHEESPDKLAGYSNQEPLPEPSSRAVPKTFGGDFPTEGLFRFTVEVEKTAEAPKVGLDVDHGDERALVVTMVKAGLVQTYNETAPPPKQIMIGDHIIEVNG